MAAELIGGAAIGAVLGELLNAVLEAKSRTFKFNSELEHLKSTLESIIPVIKEIAELNKVLDRRNEETMSIMEHIKKGETLILKCSGVKSYAGWKKARYTSKLIELEKSLKSLFQIVVQAQQARDAKETLLQVKDLRVDLKQLKASMIQDFNGYNIPEPPVNPVGLEIPLEELKSELFNDEVSIIVLSAPPGCGKTTLAKLFCHDKQVKEGFKDNIFYVIVSRKPTLEGIVQRILQHKNFVLPQCQSDEQVVYYLEQFFRSLSGPILLVLDDIWPESGFLVDKLRFQIRDYKILVTSRSEFPRFASVYKLKPMNDKNALTLFRDSAFLPGKNSDIDEDVVNKIVKRCKGFPLALKVVGRSLCGEPLEIWKKREIEMSKGGIIFENGDLFDCLQSSLDALENNHLVTECFMDLCAFPEDRKIPVNALIDMWAELYELDEHGVHAVANLQELSARNLVDLVVKRKDGSGYYDQHFVMQHDLLRELAIHNSSLGPVYQRNRLVLEGSTSGFTSSWSEQENRDMSGRLLSVSTDEEFSSNLDNIQAPEVEVLVLNFQTRTYTLPVFMGEMKKLKVLIITNYGIYPTEVSNLQLLGTVSNLKRIRLEGISCSTLDFTSTQFKNLKKLTLVLCNIGQAFSSNSSGTEAHVVFPNLVEINMDYCNDLTEFPVILCHIIQLKKLTVNNCQKLVVLPEEIGNLVNLEVLRLSSCIELLELPNLISNLQKLQVLDISECAEIKKLPQQIGDLYELKRLHMMGCSKNIELPQSISNLINLKEVICDEEIASLWEPLTGHLKNLKIKMLKEDINLNWL